MTGKTITAIGKTLWRNIKHVRCDAIAGSADAVPYITSILLAVHDGHSIIEGCYVRPHVKPHGTQKRIEGNIRPGMRVVLLLLQGEDESALRAALEEAGLIVTGTLTVHTPTPPLSAAQQRAYAKLKTYWQSAHELQESLTTLRVLVARGLADDRRLFGSILFPRSCVQFRKIHLPEQQP